MSIKAMQYVFDHSPYLLGQRLIHLAIADVVNDDYDNRVFIGDAKIAEKAKVDRRTVSRAKTRMIEDGYLEVLDNRHGPGRFTEYRFLTPMPNTGQNVPHPRAQQGTSDPPTWDIGDTQHGTSAQGDLLPTQIEPKGTQIARVPPARPVEEDFDITWRIYPRKLNRKGALNAYKARRHAGVTGKELWDATKHYGIAVTGKELDKVMHGATFYGPNDRWRDYLDGPPDETLTAAGTPPPRKPPPGRGTDARSHEELALLAHANEERETGT